MATCSWRTRSASIALYVDGERFGRHRAWRNTSVGEGNSYHTPKGVLGHEWDEVVDNGWSPPNLQKFIIYYGR